jgi:hypothetical protein
VRVSPTIVNVVPALVPAGRVANRCTWVRGGLSMDAIAVPSLCSGLCFGCSARCGKRRAAVAGILKPACG